MVLKVGMFVVCCESWFVGGGGGRLLGSVFSSDVCEFAVGYVICRGCGG
jgi:hypothetical protein